MTSQQDDIQKNLNAIGAYTHLNNLQLLPTGVEEARYAKASKVKSLIYFKFCAHPAATAEPAQIWTTTGSRRLHTVQVTGTRLATCAQKAPTSAKPPDEVYFTGISCDCIANKTLTFQVVKPTRSSDRAWNDP